ncbi:unnamed protein product [Calicophoron daubneyi]|uniref:F-box domain-containing protein n=1 Tax=Calicophoron daubneyi TaxID=300641 RepID=A0AAV2TM68_CALDB
MRMELETLPDDILLRIFSFIDPFSLYRSLYPVNKRFRILCKRPVLWTSVDLTSFRVIENIINRMMDANLLGRHTRHLRLSAKIICSDDVQEGLPAWEDLLRPVLKICDQLESLYIHCGRFGHFSSFCAILPATLRKMTFKCVCIKQNDVDPVGEMNLEFKNLESLTLTGCPWFTPVHLNRLVKPRPSKRLVYLNLSGCRGFFSRNDGDVIGHMVRIFEEVCPDLKYLGLGTVIRDDIVSLSQRVQGIQHLFESTPLLEVVDLSRSFHPEENPLNPDQATAAIIKQLFYPHRLSGRVKPCVTLGLLGWSKDWVCSFMNSASKILDSQSTLLLVVDHTVSDLTAGVRVKLVTWPKRHLKFEDLMELSRTTDSREMYVDEK